MMEHSGKCDKCDGVIGERDPYMTLHKEGEPDVHWCHACGKEDDLRRFRETRTLTSRVTLQAALVCHDLDNPGGRPRRYRETPEQQVTYREINDQMKEVEAAARRFEQTWLNEIRPRYVEAKTSGMSGDGVGFKVMLLGTAGRLLITIQDRWKQGHSASKYGGGWISVITSDDEEGGNPGRMGIQGLCATKEEAVALLTDAAERCPLMMEDQEVSIF
jgi:hypothetical protein